MHQCIRSKGPYIWRTIAALGLFGCAAPTFAGERPRLQGLLERPPIMTYVSDQSIGALEECFGIALSDLGIPTTLHGEHSVIVSAWSTSGTPKSAGVWAAVTLTPANGKTLVEVRSHAAGLLADPWGDAARSAAATCR